MADTPCRSGHTDCTVDCGSCKGTGIQGGKPHLESPDVDYTEPHQWFQYTGLPEGDPYCSGCQLPAENVRHRGRYTATITVHGNDVEAVKAEVYALTEYHHEGDGNTVWIEVDRTWE